jgi:hypothetical protein
MVTENGKAAAEGDSATAQADVGRVEQQGQHSTGAEQSKALNRREQAEQLRLLFAGNQSHHGTHGEPDWDEEKSKWSIRGTALTLPGPPTLELWEAHLAGDRPLGVVPIAEDSTCVWGCGDIDDYDVNALELIARIEAAKLPLVTCRSKSGGLHLFLFLRAPEPARAVQTTVRSMMAALGHAGCEVFPKQSQLLVDRGDQGNWMVMPYYGGTFGGKLREQEGLKKTGGTMLLSEFLRAAEGAKTTTAEVRIRRTRTRKSANGSGAPSADDGPFADGPPCLQHLAAAKVQRGGQNNALLMMGIYYKRAFPEEWRARLEAGNHDYLDPPGSAEGVVSVIRSLENKDYQYTCRAEPMASYCNSALCRTRRFGVGDAGNLPLIVGLLKLNSDEPVWMVSLEGSDQELKLRNIEDLTEYRKFNNQCAKQLDRVFATMKQAEWSGIIGRAMQEVMTIEKAPPDTTPRGRFLELLEEFLTNRTRGQRWEDLLDGRPFEDEHRKKHFFQMRFLHQFIERQGMCNASRHQCGTWIREIGGNMHEPSPTTIRGKSVRLWWVPASAIEPMPKLEPPGEKEPPI